MNRIIKATNEPAQKTSRSTPTVREAEVQVKYRGQYVVPYQRRIVAHGTDVTLVREEGMRATGKKAEELPVVPVVDLLQEIRPE